MKHPYHTSDIYDGYEFSTGLGAMATRILDSQCKNCKMVVDNSAKLSSGPVKIAPKFAACICK